MKKMETDRYKFIAIRLPYGSQFDEDDCQDALDFIKPSLIYTVNIKEAVDASERALDGSRRYVDRLSLKEMKKRGNE